MILKDLQGNVFHAPRSEFTIISPRTADRVREHWNYHAQKCELVILISRVSGRVFVSAPEWRLDEVAREADDIELEALADRFGVEELRTPAARQSLISG